jgi:hypothetical protein
MPLSAEIVSGINSTIKGTINSEMTGNSRESCIEQMWEIMVGLSTENVIPAL